MDAYITNNHLKYVLVKTGSTDRISDTDISDFKNNLDRFDGCLLLGIHNTKTNNIKYICHNYSILNNLIQKLLPIHYEGCWIFECNNLQSAFGLVNEISNRYCAFPQSINSLNLDKENKILTINTELIKI